VTFVGAVIDPRFREVVPFFEAAAKRISDRGRGLARLPCPAAGEQAMEDGLLTDTGETCTFSVDAIHSVFAVAEQFVLVDRRIYLHAQRAHRGMECSRSQPSTKRPVEKCSFQCTSLDPGRRAIRSTTARVMAMLPKRAI
jgi:hypothetical protein